MVKKTHHMNVIATTALLSLASASAAAGEMPMYWKGSGGEYVKSSSGQCVRTMHWKADSALPECEPGMAVKAKAEPKSEPAPIAKAETKPAPAPAVKTERKVEPMPAAQKPATAPAAEKLTLKEDALFDIGKAELRPQGKSELDALVAQLRDKNLNLEKISITGHASASGPSDFNKKLSEDRAMAVKSYLVENGIEADRIVTVGMGDTQPIASNDTAEGRALNRRVEIQIDALQLPGDQE